LKEKETSLVSCLNVHLLGSLDHGPNDHKSRVWAIFQRESIVPSPVLNVLYIFNFCSSAVLLDREFQKVQDFVPVTTENELTKLKEKFKV
jgi:hypothetical protein